MTLPTFPDLPGITYPRARKPMWRTDREESFSGIEVTYPTRNIPKWQYEIPISALRTSTQLPEWQELVSFYNNLYGSNGLFQYNDPLDNTVANQLFGEGDGVTTAFQLVRTGPPGGGTFTEPVYAPTTITALTVGTSSTAAYTIGDTGVISFATAPANGAVLTWSGEYAWLCRFNQDSLDLSQILYNIWELSKLQFSSQIIGS